MFRSVFLAVFLFWPCLAYAAEANTAEPADLTVRCTPLNGVFVVWRTRNSGQETGKAGIAREIVEIEIFYKSGYAIIRRFGGYPFFTQFTAAMVGSHETIRFTKSTFVHVGAGIDRFFTVFTRKLDNRIFLSLTEARMESASVEPKAETLIAPCVRIGQ